MIYDPTYFMQSQDLRTTDDDIADPINERLTLAERNERLQNQLRSLKEDLSNTRDVGGQDSIRSLWRHYYTGTNVSFISVVCHLINGTKK